MIQELGPLLLDENSLVAVLLAAIILHLLEAQGAANNLQSSWIRTFSW